MPMLLDDVATLVGVSMKAALAPVLTEVGIQTRELASLRAELRELRDRAPVAGPPGKDGADGKDGAVGAQGPPGAEGPRGKFADDYKDTFTAGKAYAFGDLVTDDGGVWICKAETTTDRPGRSGAWRLIWKSRR